MGSTTAVARYVFGAIRLDVSQVFFESALSYATVNLKPLVPGHVLVMPKRVVQRFNSLKSEEVNDLWISAQTVSKALETHLYPQGFTFAIQDGPVAGQTVPHVHVHILPRFENDFAPNDSIYEALEGDSPHKIRMDDEHRQPRSSSEMQQEADAYRLLFKQK